MRGMAVTYACTCGRTEISIKQLKDEVGMAGLKSTQTRFVHLLYIPTLAF